MVLAAVPDQNPTIETLAIEQGRVFGLVGDTGMGLTRLGLHLLAPLSRLGTIAYLDVRGWLCPVAAWQAGIDPDRLVVVRCDDRHLWPQVTAALLDGLPAVYAEVPNGMRPEALRRLAALARARRSALVLRSLRDDLPGGVAHLRMRADGVMWEGVEAGHGHLARRRLVVRAAGKGVGGIEQIFEVEDDGANPLRVVSRLAVAPAGRAAG